MQAKEKDDIIEGDDNLNNSVEVLIDPTKNPLDHNDNCDEDSNTNKNTDPLDTLTKVFPNLFADVEGNYEVNNVIGILSTIPVPAHPLFPDGMSMCNDLGRWVLGAAKADSPSNVIKAEDSNEDSSEVNNEAARSDMDNSSVIPVTATKASNPETTIVSTEPPLAMPSQYNPLADGLSGVPTKDPRTVNTEKSS
jgi:hypothetical protein